MMNKLFYLDAMFTLMQSPTLKVFDLLTITYSERLKFQNTLPYLVWKVLGAHKAFCRSAFLPKMLACVTGSGYVELQPYNYRSSHLRGRAAVPGFPNDNWNGR